MEARNYFFSITAGHSREIIVDIGTSVTRLSSGGRSNYSNIAVGSVVVKQEEGILLSSSVHIRQLTPSANFCH